MTHLVCRAFYDDEYRGEEYSPTHFVLDIDKPIIRILGDLIKKVKDFDDNTLNLLKVEFHFGFGLWTEFNEQLEDLAQEEVQYIPINSLFQDGDLQEQGYLESYRVEIYHDGDFRFSCYGKYDGHKIYTSLISLDMLENHLEE